MIWLAWSLAFLVAGMFLATVYAAIRSAGREAREENAADYGSPEGGFRGYRK